MARKFLTNIDLVKNELQNAVIQPLASAPSSPVEGQIYYDTTNHIDYIRTNSAWVARGTGAGTGDFSSNTATSVDGEVVLFSGTGGKTGKRATGSGVAKLTSGVLGTATAGTDYVAATSGSAIQKASSGNLTAAVEGTDYYGPGGTDIAVTDGGTGRSTSTTAYGLIAAGTTATGVQQTISPGTSGQFLKSAGSSALGAFATIAESDVTNLVSDLALKAPLASPTFTGTVTVPTPSGSTDAATKAYVDAASAGIDWKASVRVATTATGTLATAYENGDTVDGVALATGDRILIKNQSTGSENGIYTVNASGAPTRATDADSNTEVTGGMAVFVEEGTTNADTGWVMTNNGAITLGSTALVFTQFTGLGQVTDGAGLTKTGSTLDVNVDGSSLEISSDALRVKAAGVTNAMLAGSIAASKLVGSDIATVGTITSGTWTGTTIAVANGGTGSTTAAGARTNLGATTKYTATVGDGSTTAIAVTHSLGTKDVVCQVRQASDDAVVECDIVQTSTTVTTFTFAVAPATNAIKVVIIG